VSRCSWRQANAVDDEAKAAKGKKASAVESFAHALCQLATIPVDNAGYDSSDLVAPLVGFPTDTSISGGTNRSWYC